MVPAAMQGKGGGVNNGPRRPRLEAQIACKGSGGRVLCSCTHPPGRAVVMELGAACIEEMTADSTGRHALVCAPRLMQQLAGGHAGVHVWLHAWPCMHARPNGHQPALGPLLTQRPEDTDVVVRLQQQLKPRLGHRSVRHQCCCHGRCRADAPSRAVRSHLASARGLVTNFTSELC